MGLTEAEELSIVFVNDRQIRNFNRQYRQIDKTTDVLAFPQYSSIEEIKKLHKKMDILLGDIVINLHLAMRRAGQDSKALEREVLILLIHGLLHLLGYDHEKDAHQAEIMKKKEEELLRAITEMDRLSKQCY